MSPDRTSIPRAPLALCIALPLVVSACSATRGGPAEPGPMSPGAYPPSPASVQSGPPLQASPGDGRPISGPPTVGIGGNVIPSDPGGRGAESCRDDRDCVPAACCHPASCTPHAMAPACAAVSCSTDCQSGTMDCGAGSCACVNARCSVRWTRRGS